ncbi:MAG: hypothetical protein LBU43_00230, partial [Candidatus Accumulibacter sp.]|nr:hypothetical protein [Accumulibacter sp.]
YSAICIHSQNNLHASNLTSNMNPSATPHECQVFCCRVNNKSTSAKKARVVVVTIEYGIG